MLVNGIPERLKLRVVHDWADPAVFMLLQKRLRETGADRCFAAHCIGENLLVVCMPRKSLIQLRAATDGQLRFRPMFGP
jgi:hypothetical protein